MARKDDAGKPAKMTDDDKLLVQKVREAESAIQVQEHRVAAASAKLREERKSLREAEVNLRNVARDLPLLQG